MNSNMALCIGKPQEGFFAKETGETLAEPTCFLIHDEAALQSFFQLLVIIFLNLNLALYLISLEFKGSVCLEFYFVLSI